MLPRFQLIRKISLFFIPKLGHNINQVKTNAGARTPLFWAPIQSKSTSDSLLQKIHNSFLMIHPVAEMEMMANHSHAMLFQQLTWSKLLIKRGWTKWIGSGRNYVRCLCLVTCEIAWCVVIMRSVLQKICQIDVLPFLRDRRLRLIRQ